LNKPQLTAAIQAIATDITIASRTLRPSEMTRESLERAQNDTRTAEKRIIENGVLIAIGIGCAFLDIRDSLTRIADAHETIANHGVAANNSEGQRISR
jgi:hypothetical protein